MLNLILHLRRLVFTLVGTIGTVAFSTATPAQAVVNKIKERGYVSCGASQGVAGLSRPDEKGY